MNTCAHVVELRRSEHGFINEKMCVNGEELTYEKLVANTQYIETMPEFQMVKSKIGRKTRTEFERKASVWFDPT